jgi:hypothetical protein
VGDVFSTSTVRYGALTNGITEIVIETPSTTDTADTVVVDLSNYGIELLLSVEGFVHTTANSVIVAEAPTTAVSSGNLTITGGGSTVTDKIRVYYVRGRGSK